MKKILAADDDTTLLEFYKALFLDAGFEVETATDSASAMQKYMDTHPDLLVLDVDMPAGGGKRVFTTVRQILDLGVPVIFVTGLPEKVQDIPLSADKVSIFQKPVDGEALLTEVRRLLKIDPGA